MTKSRMSKRTLTAVLGFSLMVIGALIASIGNDNATIIGVIVLLTGMAMVTVVGHPWYSS